MRDDQLRRYARHILLPDLGGIGQSALMAAGATVDPRDPGGEIAACYLAAGGAGTLVLRPPSDELASDLAAHGPDTTFAADGDAPPVLAMPEAPAWWPHVDGDDTALAFWRGGLAATRWMAAVGNR